MSSFWGANPEELDQLGNLFSNVGSSLMSILANVSGALEQASWTGSDAESFRETWNGQGRGALIATAQRLNDEAKVLHTNASQQRVASDAAGGSLNLGALVNSPGFVLVETALGLVLLPLSSFFGGTDPVLSYDQSLVQAEMGKTPAEQAAWWNSLSPQRQAQLLALVPGSLLLLSGLPSSVRDQATTEEAQSLRGATTLQTTDTSVSAQAGLGKFVSVGANGSLVETTNANGTYTVTLSGGLSGGVGVGTTAAGAGVDLKGQATVSYTFSSQDQVNAFENGLLNATTPHLGWQDLAFVVSPIGGAALVGGQIAGQVSSYLGQFSGNESSQVWSGSLTASANVTTPGVQAAGTDSGSVSIEAGASIQYDSVTQQTTASISASGSGFADIGPVSGAASGNVNAGVTWNSSGQLQALTITGSYSAMGSADTSQFPGMTGEGGNFKVNVDLTNPQNQGLATQFINDVQKGNVAGATSAYQQLSNNSEIIFQQDNVTGNPPSGINAIVASSQYSSSTTTATGTWIKPPDGTEYVKVQ